MTTVKILAVLALPALVVRTRLDLSYVLGSYLFLPIPDANGRLFPVLSVGWTLCYEMLFYVLVCLALLFRLPVLRVVAPALGIFAGAALFNAFEFANTMVLEFLFGVLIGTHMTRVRQFPVPPAVFLLLAAWLAILIVPDAPAVFRPVTWGLPAALIVCSAVALETMLHARIPGWLLMLGNASYAIYLTHVFVVPVVYTVIARLHLLPHVAELPAVIIGGLAASSLVGIAVHLWLENPILARLRHSQTGYILASRGIV